jgi:hypothetical protein
VKEDQDFFPDPISFKNRDKPILFGSAACFGVQPPEQIQPDFICDAEARSTRIDRELLQPSPELISFGRHPCAMKATAYALLKSHAPYWTLRAADNG